MAKNEKIQPGVKVELIWLSVGLAGLAWILDSFMDSLVFHRGTIIEQIIHPGYQEIGVRLLFGTFFIAFGIYIQNIIIKLKLAETALEEEITKVEGEKNKTMAIIEAIGDGIILQDTDFRIIYQNQIQNDLQGNHVGEYCYKAYEGRDTICEWCPVELSFRDGKIHKTERNIDNGKGILWFELTGSPLKDPTGKIIGGVKVVRDITQRKRIEEALRESERRFRALFEAAPVGIGIADLEGRILECNMNMLEITGFTLDELKSLGVGATYADQNERKLLLRTLRDSRRVRDWDIRLKRKDGTIYYALLNVDLLELGGHEFLLTTARDITEQKKAEREKDRFLKAFASSTAGITIADENDRFIYVNEGYASIFGYSQEELISKTWREITPSEMIAPTKESLSVTMHNRDIGIFYGEVSGLRRDGTTVPTEVRGKGLWDENGNYQGHICVVRDITERKRIEERLKKAHDELEVRVKERTAELEEVNKALMTEITERKLAEEKTQEQAALLDKAQDAIYVLDLDQRIIYCNKSAQRLYGWKTEEIKATNADELLYRSVPPQLSDAKKTVIEKGEWAGELSQITRSDKEIIVESRWTLMLDGDGKPKSILILNTDITEKKKLQLQFLRAQRMESIGTLASGISHDINNALAPIMLSLELLKEKFTDDESKKLIDILGRSAKRGASLMKQIQSFARGVDGERRPLQVGHLIYDIKQIVNKTFPKQIEMRTDISKDLWTISGDSTQLDQVLMNLCVNARDAMSGGGTLSICADNIFIDENFTRINIEAKVGPYIVITISDTGSGISPEIMDRIFEPFFTTKEPGKGTGLGLSTSLGIVKSHGGFINVYSEVGKGTAFKVYLPVIESSETRKAEDRQLNLSMGHGELILVVDDEEQVREITRAALEKFGYKVIAANNGAEAVVMYNQASDKIKVILMDMMMPVMDGPESIRKLRKASPEVRIIGVSGLTEKEELEGIAKTHVDAFLAKPYTTENLLTTVLEVLNMKT